VKVRYDANIGHSTHEAARTGFVGQCVTQRTGLEDNRVPDLDVATVARGLNALWGVHEWTYYKGGLLTDAIEGGKLDSHSRLRLKRRTQVLMDIERTKQRADTRRRVRGHKE
jgi:hypothetical protein